MLTAIQKNIIFAILCSATVGALVYEGFFFNWLFNRDLTFARGIFGVFSTGLLVAFGRKFLELTQQTFSRNSIAPIESLHEFAALRSEAQKKRLTRRADQFDDRREAVSLTLKFAEKLLQGWRKGFHFELCVFVDRNEPILFSYFDSNHETTARSMKDREANPKYYIEKKYEVVKLLQAPTSRPRVILDTHAASAKYTFTSKNQKKQIRSTILICLDLDYPCALVISSNQPKAFSEDDRQLIAFVRFIGEMVRADLFEDAFIMKINTLKPQMFSKSIKLLSQEGTEQLALPQNTASAPQMQN